MSYEDPAHTGDDTRELGPAHDICKECGECTCEDCDNGHRPNCSYHPQAYEPDARDEWDSPCEEPEEMTR